jgi:hypothetical protein
MHCYTLLGVYDATDSDTEGTMTPRKSTTKNEEEVDEEFEVDLDEVLDDDLEEVLDDDADVDVVDVDDDDEDSLAIPVAKPIAEDDDVILDADDVEASLDEILKERLVVDDVDDDSESPDPDPSSDGMERVLPKQADEFVCKSCFLVKSFKQLADKKRELCRDCV